MEAGTLAFDKMAKASEAFEVTLVTPNSRFDQWLEGNDGARSSEQKAGLEPFLGKGCASCISGFNVGGQDFPFGLIEGSSAEILPPNENGRYRVTKTIMPLEAAQTPNPTS